MGSDLQQSVNPHVIRDAAAHAASFAAATPFRHVAIDDFFADGLLAELVESFPDFDEELAINENGVVGGKAVNEKVAGLGPAWRRLDELVKSAVAPTKTGTGSLWTPTWTSTTTPSRGSTGA